MSMSRRTTFIFGLAVALACMPGAAFAETGVLQSASLASEHAAADAGGSVQGSALVASLAAGAANVKSAVSGQIACEMQATAPAAVIAQRQQAAEAANKVLAYDPADVAAIGNQQQSGHMICCPSYSCAYADAVLDGTVHDHDYYTCSWCTWTDWGGGNSAYRCVGTDEQLLREAYDQIAAGRPTVVHVNGGYGEHWIALIGYQGVADPDRLTLANFIALDPIDGAQIVASDRYSLYGDGCEHISGK